MAVEFEQAKTAMEHALDESAKARHSSYENYRLAEEQHRILRDTQERMLAEVLEQKGLAVCTKDHIGLDRPRKFKKGLKSVGVYPKKQMRLHFNSHYFFNYGQDPGPSSWGMSTSIQLLCPEHYPSGEDRIVPPPQGGKGREPGYETEPDIYSEVKMVDGKFIRQVDSEDITELVKRLGSRYAWVNGAKIPHPEVYKALGIRELPKLPGYNQVWPKNS